MIGLSWRTHSAGVGNGAGPGRASIREGRWWGWCRRGPADIEGYRKHSFFKLHAEWHFGMRERWPLGFQLKFGGSEYGIALSVHAWRLFYVFAAIEQVLPKFGYSGVERCIALDVSPYTVRWNLWVDAWGRATRGRSAAAPKWRDGSVDLTSLLKGRAEYEQVPVSEPVVIEIPLPERTYQATAQVVETHRWRSRWPGREVERYVDVEIESPGLPHPGKGENSYDCGQDGTYGYSSEGESLAAAISKGVEITMRNRERYGTIDWRPSEALA